MDLDGAVFLDRPALDHIPDAGRKVDEVCRAVVAADIAMNRDEAFEAARGYITTAGAAARALLTGPDGRYFSAG